MSIDESHEAIACALERFPRITACGLKASVPCAPLDPARSYAGKWVMTE